jgi:hypothetical protein
MYVFLLTVSFLCNEQSPAVAEQHGCNSLWMSVPVERVDSYFASEAGCMEAARALTQKASAVSAHIATHIAKSLGAAATALDNPHVGCRRVALRP